MSNMLWVDTCISKGKVLYRFQKARNLVSPRQIRLNSDNNTDTDNNTNKNNILLWSVGRVY